MQTLSRLVPYISRLKSRIYRIVAHKNEKATPLTWAGEGEAYRSRSGLLESNEIFRDHEAAY
eukprot:SAG31_NODE_5517_length_2482_cov_3.611414_6_plen_62_part_00